MPTESKRKRKVILPTKSKRKRPEEVATTAHAHEHASPAVAVTFAEGTALPHDDEARRREIDAAEKALDEANKKESAAVALMIQRSREMEEARQQVEAAQKAKADAQEKLARLRARHGRALSVGTFSIGSTEESDGDGPDGKPRARDTSRTSARGEKEDPESGDDDDSGEEEIDEVIVTGCGTDAINGTYWRNTPDGAQIHPEYCMHGEWEGRNVEFSLHYEHERWTISILKDGERIRFYYAPADESSKLPPRDGWKGPAYKGRGMNPAPRVIPVSRVQSSENARFHKQMRRMNSNDGEDLSDDGNGVNHTLGEPPQMVVKGCGTPSVNGVYTKFGVFDGVAKYQKIVRRDGFIDNVLLYRSQAVISGEHRWMISMTPDHTSPGTMNDEYYYTAPSTETSVMTKMIDSEIPPKTGWTTAFAGAEPAPRVYPRYGQDGEETQGAHGGPSDARDARVHGGRHGKLLRLDSKDD